MSSSESRLSISKLESMLQCPVCLETVRELPIPCCQAGHIICKSCRQNVRDCPTCRRVYPRDPISNSLAASFVDELPHKCKFSSLGCEEKLFLSELVKHEARCPERSVKCPFYHCNETSVQIKKYNEHCQTKCGIELVQYNTVGFEWSMFLGFFAGSELGEMRMDNDESFKFTIINFTKPSKTCYLGCNYHGVKKLFFFYVMADKGEEEELKARISFQNKVSETTLSFVIPCISIEEAPRSWEDFFANKDCKRFHYETMKEFFEFIKMSDKWAVNLATKIDLL